MTKKKIITATLIVTLCHFIITSVLGHYIAVQIGTEMGQIVASGLTETGTKDSTKTAEDAGQIYQNMKEKSKEIQDKWQIPQLLISLPAKPILNPLLKEIRQLQMNKAIAKEINLEQLKTQALIIDNGVRLFNSFSIGLLVYAALRILRKTKPEDNNCLHADAG